MYIYILVYTAVVPTNHHVYPLFTVNASISFALDNVSYVRGTYPHASLMSINKELIFTY